MLSISSSSWTLLSTLVLLLIFQVSEAQSQSKSQSNLDDDSKLVPVILGVMSRCPDALLCESVFDDVLKEVGSKMSLEMTYIAKENKSDSEFGATCKHGRLECAGNVQQLCAAKHTERSHWWGFIDCMDYGSKDKIGEDDTAQRCAKASGIDWEDSGLKECVEGDEGIELFHQSIARTNELGITKSCTIIINGQVRCIRDGTWYDCEEGHAAGDFVRIIKKEYAELNSNKFDSGSSDQVTLAA